MSDQLWFCGPEWLTDWKNWPIQKSYERSTTVRSDDIQMGPILVPDRSVIGINRFSSLGKLLRTTQYIFSFLKKRVNMDMPDPLKYWLKLIQGKACEEEHKL